MNWKALFEWLGQEPPADLPKEELVLVVNEGEPDEVTYFGDWDEVYKDEEGPQ